MSGQDFFDSSFLIKLNRLALASRRRFASHRKGERRSTRKGSSLEFIDYRHYTAGDDPRQVDWNAYGRSGSLFVKLFEEEEVVTASLLLDTSRSMDWGQPNKFDYGRRLAAAIGYIVLAGLDRVAAVTMGDGQHVSSFGPVWGRKQVTPLFDFLAQRTAQGETDLGAAASRFVDIQRQPGVAILISDLLSPTAEAGIKRLLAHRDEVAVIHVVAPQEQTPPLGEGMRLVDRETGQVVEIYLDQRAIDLYQQRFADWCGALQRFCAQHGALYQRIDSATSLEQVLFDLLRRGGILR